MSFLLFFVPFLGVAITAIMLLEDYIHSFSNEQFITMNLPHALMQPISKLKVMAKAAARH